MIMAVSFRQCVTCRKKFPKKTLIRIVRSPAGEVAVDANQRLPGRGFYLCRNSNCLEKARKLRILDHRTERHIPESLYLETAHLIPVPPESPYIGFARRSREILTGVTVLEKRIDQVKVYLLLMDEDTRKWTRRKMQSWSERKKIPLIVLTRQLLENLTGKAGCRTAGITHPGLASRIIDTHKQSPSPKR